jgi:pseudouridine-5'-phosphate glycosidase
MTLSKYLTFAPDVAEALAEGRPVVALESTIITHGMPWPQNVQTARAVEAEVRGAGAAPATLAVLEGKIHIGLTDDQLQALGQAKDVMKVSRADLAACVALGLTGATTVAAQAPTRAPSVVATSRSIPTRRLV